MEQNAGQQDSWSIGELAGATGLSVRALRHWDRIELVCPSRSEGGHRRYDPTTVTRLYRALALRELGLSLDQTRAVLDGTDPSPEATLRAQLARVDTELAVG